MQFKRKIFRELEKHLDRKQVTVLTGMRRTGKRSEERRVGKECTWKC